jgi:hypothetical protein
MSFKDIRTKFEKNNKSISVNVFGYEKFVYPIQISDHPNREIVIDLLYIKDDEDKSHYCLIKNLSGLLRADNGNQYDYYCRKCLNSFREESSLIDHKKYCNQVARAKYPKPGSIGKFKNYNRSTKVPFIVYADFESFIKPIDTCQPDPSESYTKAYQKHTPSSFCYYIKIFDGSHKISTFTAESEDDDVAQIFVDRLIQDLKWIYEKYPYKHMNLSKEEEEIFKKATICHICKES